MCRLARIAATVSHSFGGRQLRVFAIKLVHNDFFSPGPGTTMFRAKSHPDWTRIGELLLICISLIGLAYFLFGPR